MTPIPLEDRAERPDLKAKLEAQGLPPIPEATLAARLGRGRR